MKRPKITREFKMFKDDRSSAIISDEVESLLSYTLTTSKRNLYLAILIFITTALTILMVIHG